jgi:hypothetical protein
VAQRTDPDLRELKDLMTGLREEIRTGFVDADKKIEALDKKIDLGFVDADKKIEALDKKVALGFVDTDKKIEILDKKIDLGFSEVKGEIKLVDSRLTAIEATLTKLDSRLWTFIGIVLSVTLGTLLTIFVRYMFSDSVKF